MHRLTCIEGYPVAGRRNGERIGCRGATRFRIANHETLGREALQELARGRRRAAEGVRDHVCTGGLASCDEVQDDLSGTALTIVQSSPHGSSPVIQVLT